MRTLVTGGAGYIGMELVDELLTAGQDVTVLDVLLHDQADRAEDLRRRGVKLVEGDVRDRDKRAEALEQADAVVHLAAIVGDPACALPRRSPAPPRARPPRRSRRRSTSTPRSRSPRKPTSTAS